MAVAGMLTSIEGELSVLELEMSLQVQDGVFSACDVNEVCTGDLKER